MSETPPPVEEAKEKKSKKITAPKVLVIVVVVSLLVILILNWTYGIRQANARKDAYKQGVSGLATSLRRLMLEGNSAITERIIIDVAKNANYDSVEVSDTTGRVIASTNRQTSGQTIEAMAKATSETTHRQENGKWVFVTGIYLAEGNRLGSLRVTLTP